MSPRPVDLFLPVTTEMGPAVEANDDVVANSTADSSMGDADMFAGMTFGNMPTMTSLPTLPSEKETKTKVSEATTFLEMLKTVPLTELLKDGCKLPADENQVVDLWAVTEHRGGAILRIESQGRVPIGLSRSFEVLASCRLLLFSRTGVLDGEERDAAQCH